MTILVGEHNKVKYKNMCVLIGIRSTTIKLAYAAVVVNVD